MKKHLKKTVTTFFILSLVFFVAWAAIFAINGLDLTKASTGSYDFMNFLNNWFVLHFLRVVDLFTGARYGFVPNGADFYFILTYAGFLVAAVSLALIVIGLIFTIKFKRKRTWPYVLVILAATAAVLELLANIHVNPGDAYPVVGQTWQGYEHYLTFKVTPGDVTAIDIAFTFSTIACAMFAYIFMIACTIVAIIRARLLALPEAEEEEEEDEDEEEAEETEEVSEDLSESFATKAATEAPVVAEEEPVEEIPSEETLKDFEVEPEPLEEKPELLIEEVPSDKDVVRKGDLESILKDIVRDIVRDEIARSNAAREEERPNRDRGDHSITGATFGGPLVVQYFNGGINPQQPAPQQVVAPAPQPAPAPAPQPAPAQEPKKEEPAPAPQPEPAPVAAPAPAEEAKEEGDDGKNPIIRIPFTERMLSAEKDMQNDYNELKNEILSYGVNSRVSNSGDTFRLHRKTYVKITIAGKSLKLYFALNPADYADTTLPFSDASHHAVYAEIPFVFKVKSGLSMRRAKDLIRDVMSKDGLEQGEIGTVNWVKELKAAK